MKVELLTSKNSLQDMERNATQATLICHGNEGKQVVNQEVLTRIIGYGHESILEHIYLTYRVQDISRAVLQELARHRHITLSVESTRHTLRKNINNTDWYSVLYGSVNDDMKEFLRVFRKFADMHPLMPNDELKYYLPEFLTTSLFMTLNVRELRHVLSLRTSPRALEEFQDLARALFEAVPDEFKYLLKDCVHEEA